MLSQERCLISSPPGNRSYGVKLRGSYGCFAYMTLSRSFGRSGTVVYMITSWSKDLSSVLGVILFYVASGLKLIALYLVILLSPFVVISRQFSFLMKTSLNCIIIQGLQ